MIRWLLVGLFGQLRAILCYISRWIVEFFGACKRLLSNVRNQKEVGVTAEETADKLLWPCGLRLVGLPWRTLLYVNGLLDTRCSSIFGVALGRVLLSGMLRA